MCRNADSPKTEFVDLDKALERQAIQLMRKSCLKWSSLVDDKGLRKVNKIMLLYNGQDCGSCVKKGLEIVNKIEKETSLKSIVISSQSNFANDRVQLGYDGFIYEDREDILRKELDYCYTPIILIIGKDNKILAVHFPKANDKIDNISTRLVLSLGGSN